MIKVAVWGTGMMGTGLLGYILDRPKQIDLVGVIDRHPEKHGRTVGEVIGRECDIPVTADFESVLAKKPDVVCILTASNLHEISDHPDGEQPARDLRPGRTGPARGRQRHRHRGNPRVPVGHGPGMG